jgi:hypothetical protein
LNFAGQDADSAALTKDAFGSAYDRLAAIKSTYDPNNIVLLQSKHSARLTLIIQYDLARVALPNTSPQRPVSWCCCKPYCLQH